MRSSIASWSDLALKAAAALRRVEGYGVRWQGTRFDRYMRVINQCAEEEANGALQRVADRFTFEAINQGAQLMYAASVFDFAPLPVLVPKLRKIVSGRDVLDDDSAPDLARDTLFEFTVGELLWSRGFEIEFTDAEDVIASHRFLRHRLSVECKRPARCATEEDRQRRVRSNLLALRDQLRRRDPRNIGVGVIGMDGVWGTSDQLIRAESVDNLFRGIRSALARNVAAVRALVANRSLRLTPPIRLGALVFLGVGMVTGKGACAMQSMRIFNLDDDRRLAAALRRIVGRENYSVE